MNAALVLLLCLPFLFAHPTEEDAAIEVYKRMTPEERLLGLYLDQLRVC